jgi:ATP-dependent RNA helicase DDX21
MNRTETLSNLCKIGIFENLVKQYAGNTGKAIVFTQTKAEANEMMVSDKLKSYIEVLHGDIA